MARKSKSENLEPENVLVEALEEIEAPIEKKSGWHILSAEDRMKAEKEKKLVGYNPRTGECLLSQ
jgi:hypothetical protein